MRPSSVAQVAEVLAACNEAVVPVTAAAGRSGVCGGSIPVHGGVALDMTGLDGVVRVDETSLTMDVRAGTFGPDLEAALGRSGDDTARKWCRKKSSRYYRLGCQRAGPEVEISAARD